MYTQDTLTVALNYQNIKKNFRRKSKIKPFINKYDWKEIYFPTQQKDWKKFQLNNSSIVPNVFFVPYGTETIRLAYKSTHNLKRENQVILIMITDGEKCDYLAVKTCLHYLKE